MQDFLKKLTNSRFIQNNSSHMSSHMWRCRDLIFLLFWRSGNETQQSLSYLFGAFQNKNGEILHIVPLIIYMICGNTSKKKAAEQKPVYKGARHKNMQVTPLFIDKKATSGLITWIWKWFWKHHSAVKYDHSGSAYKHIFTAFDVLYKSI